MEILVIAIALGLAGAAEWKHHKSGNGKRFEKIINMMQETGDS